MFTTAFVLLLSVASAMANLDHIGSHAQRGHQDLAKRIQRGDSEGNYGAVNLQKRSFSGTFTYYDVTTGPVACDGRRFQGSAFIVAMNTPQFKQSDCFNMITITANGKTTQAQIVDECPTCAYGFLDLSEGLANFFDSNYVNDGVVQGSWHYSDDAPAPPPAPKPSPSPSPKPKPKPKPSSTSAKASSTSTSAAHSSMTMKASSTMANVTVTSTSVATASIAVPSADPLIQAINNSNNVQGALESLNSLFINLGGLVIAAQTA